MPDWELYRTKDWTGKPARLRIVGLAPDTPFATKPQLVRRMLERVLEAGLPVAWVKGASVHGHSADLRIRLEKQGQSHVLAVPANERVGAGFHQVSVQDILACLPEADWKTQACSLGAKGPRLYDR